MSEYSISVVIAAYNAERFVEKAIESALAQSYKNFNICIVDDGSTDSTSKIIRRFKGDSRFTLITQCNQGPAAAKNRGAFESSGELIAFLDADDMWCFDKLQKQVLLFENPSVGVVYALSSYIDGQGNATSKQPPQIERSRGVVTEKLFQNNFVPFSSAIIRRDIFERIGGHNISLKMGSDWDLWLRASLFCQFDYINERQLLYRIWQGQISSNLDGRIEWALRIMDSFVASFPDKISSQVRRRAYAETYANRAYHRYYDRRDLVSALADIFRAIGYQTTNLLAWKTLARIAVRKPRKP